MSEKTLSAPTKKRKRDKHHDLKTTTTTKNPHVTAVKNTEPKTEKDLDAKRTHKSKYEVMSCVWSNRHCVEVEDCRQNKNALFVYADNDKHMGISGQACVRHEPNAMGIPVKKGLGWDKASFYVDTEFDKNTEHINLAIANIKKRVDEVGAQPAVSTIFFPREGLGAGYSMLKQNAPKTYRYLCEHVHREFGIKNVCL